MCETLMHYKHTSGARRGRRYAEVELGHVNTGSFSCIFWFTMQL